MDGLAGLIIDQTRSAFSIEYLRSGFHPNEARVTGSSYGISETPEWDSELQYSSILPRRAASIGSEQSRLSRDLQSKGSIAEDEPYSSIGNRLSTADSEATCADDNPKGKAWLLSNSDSTQGLKMGIFLCRCSSHACLAALVSTVPLANGKFLVSKVKQR